MAAHLRVALCGTRATSHISIIAALLLVLQLSCVVASPLEQAQIQAGGRKVLQGGAAEGVPTTPLDVGDGVMSVGISKDTLSIADTLAQVQGRAAYFAAGGPAQGNIRAPTGGTNAAITQVNLGGGYNFLSGFTMDVKIGTPGVTQSVVVDTGSVTCWVQGSGCTTCTAGNNGCPSNFPSNCATGTSYDDTASSTKQFLSCTGACSTDTRHDVGCDYYSNFFGTSVPNRCEYSVAYGSGYTLGFFLSDIASVAGQNGQLTARINFGESVYEDKFTRFHGLFGFGPDSFSYPQQLKAQGTIPSSTFALCQDGGQSKTGNLFLGGVPTLTGLVVNYVPLKVSPQLLLDHRPPHKYHCGRQHNRSK